ncbi:CPBP family intramembrane metalloprotease [Clostridioides difficile]|nr:CPBP family intramembrane metalloprotease [Clostridioides difficile]
MSNDIKLIKKEINYFLLINFLLIAFISIFLFLSVSKPNNSEFISNFSLLFMYIPAFSAIVVLKRVSSYKFNSTVDKFLKFFAIVTIVRIVISIAETFLIDNSIISATIDTLTSFYLLVVVLYNEFQFEVLNLSLGKNFKKVLSVILIFLIIIIITIIINNENLSINIINKFVIAFLNVIINLCFGFNLFFGEEFGWRYFLQPRLQKIYGKKFGVIILGFIWGIWHLPLCITLYSPETPFYCVISHISYCTFIGIFLGYTYMKTKNLWAPILIHLVNNNVYIILKGGNESIFTLESLLWSIAIDAILFLPFLFTKEYKANNPDENSN